MLMVKPALSYLDIVKDVKENHPEYPLFVYQVSGEYAMLYHASKEGAIDLKSSLNEVLLSMRRAGIMFTIDEKRLFYNFLFRC